MEFNHDDFCGAILAGGKSKRFGEDKALIGQIPLYRIAINQLKKVGINKIILIRNIDDLSVEYPVYCDIIKDNGPLGGLFTALSHSQKKPVLALSCDMPAVSCGLLKRLLAEYDNKTEITIYKSENKYHPFPAIYDSSLRSKIAERMKKSQLSMVGFIESTEGVKIISADECKGNLININRREDFDRYKESIQ